MDRITKDCNMRAGTAIMNMAKHGVDGNFVQ